MKKPIALTVSGLLAAACLSGAAWAQSGQTGAAGQGGSSYGGSQSKSEAGTQDRADRPSAAKAASQLASADVRFLKQAAQDGLAEVEAAKLAQTKATTPDIKTFAQQLIDDHGKTHEELKQLAQSKGVELPNEPSVAQRAKLKMLAAADGDKFDRRFSDQFGVKAHQDTIRMFRNQVNKSQDADVKSFAQKTLAGLEKHLSMAQTMQASVAPGRRMGSGTQAGDTSTGSGTSSGARGEQTDKADKKQQ